MAASSLDDDLVNYLVNQADAWIESLFAAAGALFAGFDTISQFGVIEVFAHLGAFYADLMADFHEFGCIGRFACLQISRCFAQGNAIEDDLLIFASGVFAALFLHV